MDSAARWFSLVECVLLVFPLTPAAFGGPPDHDVDLAVLRALAGP